MKKTKNLTAFILGFSLIGSLAYAQSWNGNDPDNDDWSSGLNWVGGDAPVNGGAVLLPDTLTPGTTLFDQANLRLGSLTLNSTAGSGWTIDGGSETLRVIQGGAVTTTVFSSSGSSINTITPHFSIVQSDGSASNARITMNVAAGNSVVFNNSFSAFGIRIAGTGTTVVNGDLSFSMPDGGATNSEVSASLNLLAGGTFRFNGSTFTSDNAFFNLANGSTLIWNSDAPLTKFIMLGADNHIVTAQNISKSADNANLGTGPDHFGIRAGVGNAFGFSALGGVRTLDLTAPGGLVWSNQATGNTLITGNRMDLNTHSEATHQIQWISNILLRDNVEAETTSPKTIRVGDVAGVAVDAIFSGVIADRNAGSFKNNVRTEGPGVLLLTGNNTNVGNWTVASGTLLIGGTTSGQGDFTVNSGATFGGSGTLGLASGKTVTLEQGSFLTSGRPDVDDGRGIFTITAGGVGGLDLSAIAGEGYGALRFDLAGVGSSDRLILSGGQLDIGSGLLGWDDFVFLTYAGFGEGTYTLFELQNGATLDGSLGSSISGNIGGFSGTLALDMDNNLTLTVIPEPSTYALGMGAMVLFVILLRRRR